MLRDPLLTPAELQTFLSAHPEWSVNKAGELDRTFTFEKFLVGIHFVQTVGSAADAADHHPDLDVRYNKVSVRLSTHDSHGLTARDSKLAAECDRIAKTL